MSWVFLMSGVSKENSELIGPLRDRNEPESGNVVAMERSSVIVMISMTYSKRQMFFSLEIGVVTSKKPVQQWINLSGRPRSSKTDHT